MDGTRFDHFIRYFGNESSRRIIVRRVASGLGAVVLGQAAVETGEAQRRPNRCRRVGRSCKKRPGQPKPVCCAGAICHRNSRCQCGPNRRRCGRKCLNKNQCCRSSQCTGAEAGNCVNNRCRAAFQTCTAERGRVSFVKKGPGNPPYSDGSVRFAIGPEPALADWAHLRFSEFAGTPLADITSIRYSVFVRTLSDGTCPDQENPYLVMYVTAGGNDHILVSSNLRPNTNACDNWQTLEVASSVGRWWMPTNTTFAPIWNPRPLSDFIGEYPDIAIRNATSSDPDCPGATGGLRLAAGEWPGGEGDSVSHVSFLRVATTSSDRMFRF